MLSLVFVALLLLALSLLFAANRVVSAIDAARREATIRHLQAIFSSAIQAARDDPQQFLVWYPLAQTSRRLFPEAFSALDSASGGTFPFSREQVQEAHARCTAQWLAWERSHDGEYALKAAALQEELARAGQAATPISRARVAALDRDKLERYQERYERYIRTAKALQALME